MERADLSSLRVLILGGKSHALTILRSVLNNAGVKAVLMAPDTPSAIEVLSRENVSAVFFDAHAATGFGGVSFPVAVRRKAIVINPMVPLYCVYDRARRRDVEKARDNGVTDVLTAPISPRAILSKLKAPARPFIVAQEFFGPDRRSKRRPPFMGDDRRKRTAKKAKFDFAHV